MSAAPSDVRRVALQSDHGVSSSEVTVQLHTEELPAPQIQHDIQTLVLNANHLLCALCLRPVAFEPRCRRCGLCARCNTTRPCAKLENVSPFNRYFEEVSKRVQTRKQRFPYRPVARTPFKRVWPVTREIGAVMGATVLLVLVAPAPFTSLPAPFDVRPSDPPWLQARAALLSGGVLAVTFLSSFTLYGVWYMQRQRALVFSMISFWTALSIGGPLTLLLCRVSMTVGVPIDAITLGVLVANLALPGTVLVWWHATRERFALCRRLHAAALSTLCAWLLSYLPWPTLVAIFGTLAFLDIVLVALPCCSPVQALDKLYYTRAAAGDPAMPGLTYADDFGRPHAMPAPPHHPC